MKLRKLNKKDRVKAKQEKEDLERALVSACEYINCNTCPKDNDECEEDDCGIRECNIEAYFKEKARKK